MPEYQDESARLSPETPKGGLHGLIQGGSCALCPTHTSYVWIRIYSIGSLLTETETRCRGGEQDEGAPLWLHPVRWRRLCRGALVGIPPSRPQHRPAAALNSRARWGEQLPGGHPRPPLPPQGQRTPPEEAPLRRGGAAAALLRAPSSAAYLWARRGRARGRGFTRYQAGEQAEGDGSSSRNGVLSHRLNIPGAQPNLTARLGPITRRHTPHLGTRLVTARRRAGLSQSGKEFNQSESAKREAGS